LDWSQWFANILAPTESVGANGAITPELALKVGQAAGQVFQRGEHRHRVVIGKDTRLSGYMIETALVAGFTPSAWMCCCSARCRRRRSRCFRAPCAPISA
jgi:hypothetical protein